MSVPISTFLFESPLSVLKEMVIKSVNDANKQSYSVADDQYRATLKKIDKISSLFTTLSYVFSISVLIITPSIFALGMLTQSATMLIMISKITVTGILILLLLNRFIDHKKTQIIHLYSNFFTQIYSPNTFIKAYLKNMHSFEYAILTATEKIPYVIK